MTIALKGYQVKEKIHEGITTLVYRGRRLGDEKAVVIKLLKTEYPTFAQLVQFRNQYAIAINLDLPGVVVPVAMENYRNGFALIMEDYGGICLKNYLAGKPLNLDEFFPIAISLAKTLEGLELNRVIHKDIKPSNILINPVTKELKLIDFSIASLLPRETQEIQNPNVLEGTLAYISPEQTGRMNRGIDYRTDFYSLGVTFYELLAGELPFQSDDPLELVHCHIAKMPPALGTLAKARGKRQEAIPGVVSDIVFKLMAKKAEDRYQTARGIRHDLEICWQQWEEKGSIASFSLGMRDASDRFLIPEKLYGREREVERLLAAFERVSGGKTEIMLVAGFSGIGKTAVVSEVHKPILRQRGYFIKGKFDQFQRNIPFSALAQAFSSLMGQLLAESEASLQKWKGKILAALGESGRVIIDVIPELERIIGKQPPVAELSGSAAQNRFNLLFGKFVGAIATIEHPLVIFLDDLQWADSASLKLMQLLAGDGDTLHLLLIGAYRDNEVNPTHPLMLTIDELGKSGARVNRITLAPLNLDALNRLVADTLGCSLERSLPLSELVHQKTLGNPFFSTQFLKSLHAESAIYFNFDAGCWECDIAKVKELSLTDDVVEFMALQLRKLPESTRDALKLAACIGNQFDLETLAIARQHSQTQTAVDLWKALQEGLIIPIAQTYKFYQAKGNRSEENPHSLLSDNPQQPHPLNAVNNPLPNSQSPKYKFLHDRVQQAAYSLIPEPQKKPTHLKIGRLLLAKTAPFEREARIFDIVDRLNMGVELVCEKAEKQQLAEFNLIAGRKAKAAAAFRAAYEYCNIGLGLLDTSSWQERYELALALHKGGAEAAYLSGNFDRMEELTEIAIARSRSLLERIEVYELRIQAAIANNRLVEAIDIALEVLKMLGVKLPKKPHPIKILWELGKTKIALWGKSSDRLLRQPDIASPEVLATIRVANSILSACFIAAPELFSLLAFKIVNLSLKHGSTALSAPAWACYALIISGIVGDIETGYKFGQLALSLLDRFHAKQLEAKILFLLSTFVTHWKEHVRDTLKPTLEAYASGLETGDLEFAARTANAYCYNSYFIGKELSELQKEMANFQRSMAQSKQENALNYNRLFRQGALNFIESNKEPWRLQGEFYDEEEMLPQHERVNDRTSIFELYINKIILGVFFNNCEIAVTYANIAKEYLDADPGAIVMVLFYFYDSLALLGSYSQQPKLKQRQFWRRARSNQKKLQKWARHGPMNYAHKFYLVEAERHRVLGEKLEAIEMYDRAIAGAKENEFLHEEALASELAAKFYLEWGKETIAEAYLAKAYYAYARWGAKAKVEDLEQRYPRYLVPILNRKQTSLTAPEIRSRLTLETVTVANASSTPTVLDLATVIKASLVISAEIELENLLSTLMEAVMQNAGAQTGVLILLQEENPMLAVRCVAEECHVTSQTSATVRDVPLSIVNYVRRATETTVIENAAKDTTLTADPYIIENQPLSVLCTPIINRGRAIALLYLENNLVTGAFTSDRLELLKILCSQAAVSLENAQLYQQSQDYAQKLERSLQQLQEAQLQLVQGEKMAAIGQLAAGIAHEINNPVGFISGNLAPARDYLQDLIKLINLYQQYYPEPAAEIAAEIEAIDLEYLLEDLPELIDSMEEGTKRIAEISRSMRTFSRADTASKVFFNIHDGINSTLTILKHRFKAVENRREIELIKNYGDLPEIKCYPGQLNQVFLNIIANAIDALEEGDRSSHPNQIIITTEAIENGSWVAIRIKDNGPGMSEEVKRQVFEHLFTTKPPGKGTGLGLSISRQIVVEKHGGRLGCVVARPGKFSGSDVAEAERQKVARPGKFSGSDVAEAEGQKVARPGKFSGSDVAEAEGLKVARSGKFSGSDVAEAEGLKVAPSGKFSGSDVAEAEGLKSEVGKGAEFIIEIPVR